jgi:deoxyribodipyrimidine photo-lyase
LNSFGSDLLVKYGRPEEVWKAIFETYDVQGIFSNKDYEPYALERDAHVAQLANARGAWFKQYKDQCIFEFDEVLKDDGKPYTVFTPYSKKWKAKLATQQEFYLKAYATENYVGAFVKEVKFEMPSLQEMGFEALELKFPAKESSVGLIKKYKETRDFPAIEGTSKLGVHFRFGTISIRAKARKALPLSETYLNELIWRDFYMQILAHFPHVAKGAFKPAYDKIAWRNNEVEFAAWCEGRTGYPIVDAGMRELNATGFMHNRVRMIVASFLTKHLLIDWRWGEAYFAKKLLDFDLSANNGGWQWAAGSGTDAAPYFRVFNPALQTAKFDAKGEYIKKWVPEYASLNYPKPIVVHELARKRCLETYKAALG